jgi:multidrug efflux pump subunit AcrA (membrane-fusion protein)
MRRRAIEVGRRSETTVEVVSGLQPGEQVVVGGALLLGNAIDAEV